MSIIKDMSDIPYSSKTTELEPYTESFDINNDSIDFDTLDTYDESEYVFNEYNLDRIKDDADTMQENWYNDIDGDLLNKEELYQSWIDNLESETTPWNNIEWESDPETDPYSFRESPDFGHEYNAEEDELIGGTYAWNQLVPDSNINHTASGAVVTVDDAVAGNAVSVVADIAPVQDGTPWQSGLHKTPYIFQRTPQLGHDYNSEFVNAIVGGTVAWNQLVQNGNFASNTGWAVESGGTMSISDGIITGTCTESGAMEIRPTSTVKVIANHKYLCLAVGRVSNPTTAFKISTVFTGTEPRTYSTNWDTVAFLSYSASDQTTDYPRLRCLYMNVGDTFECKSFMMLDLTALFGSATIADYLYSLEQTTAGSGIAKLKEWGFDIDSYHAYETGSLESVNVSAHETVGKNLISSNVWSQGYLHYEDGKTVDSNAYWVYTPDYICVSNFDSVTFGTNITNRGIVYLYDSNKNHITSVQAQLVKYVSANLSVNIKYVRLGFNINGAAVAVTPQSMAQYEPQLEIGSTATDYEPYIKHSYPLDSDLTLRGIPKLDSSNNLYYDGDVYEPSGAVTRKYGIVDLGTLDWDHDSASTFKTVSRIPNAVGNSKGPINGVCSKYLISPGGTDALPDKSIGIGGVTGMIFIYDSSFENMSASDFKAAMNGVYLVYELATPTTETADPYTAIQTVDPYGTEEYIDYGVEQGTRDIAVPVGHQSVYADIVPIEGWDEIKVYVSPTEDEEDATIYTIDLDDTRYGGTLDVTTGKLTLTMAEVDLGSLNWVKQQTASSSTWRFYTTQQYFVKPSSGGTKPSILCSAYETITPDATWWGAIGVSVNHFDGSLMVSDSAYTDAAEFKSAMNGIKLVHELATPVEVSLTPTQIAMYAGTNYVWNDVGNTTLTYSSDTAYIDLLSNHKYLTKVSNAWSVVTGGNTVTTKVGQDAVYDLTQMFGTTIANYIDTTETATSGAGVAWFRKYFPNTRYKYEDGSLESVNTSEHVMVGFNQWDEEWESGNVGYYNGALVLYADPSAIRNKNYMPVVEGATYYVKGAASFVGTAQKDVSNAVYIGAVNNASLTVPSGIHYLRFSMFGTTYNNDICINLSKTEGTPKNGDYVAYSQHSYPLDSTITLRGIPKLDSNNNLIYDGDTYKFDGSVTRKYGIVDLGTLEWDVGNSIFFSEQVPNFASPSSYTDRKTGFINSRYPADTQISIDLSAMSDKSALRDGGRLYIKDTSYTDAASFKTAMSGVYLVFELETETTETASAYRKFQTVDPDGTEEYVDYGVLHNTRDVSIPVGHDTTYVLISEIEESYYKNDTVTSISDPDGLFLCIQDCDNTQPLPTPESPATAYWVRFNTRGINSYNFDYIGEFAWNNVSYNINDMVWVDEGDIKFYVCTNEVSYSSENTPANDTAHWINLFSVHRDSFQIYDTMPNQSFFNNVNSPTVFGVVQSDGTSIKIVDRRHSESPSNPTYLNLKQLSYTIFLPNQGVINVDIGTSMQNLLYNNNIGNTYMGV